MKKLLFEKKYINSFIIVFGTFFFIILPLLFSLDVHAQSLSGLPYYVDYDVPFSFDSIVNQAFNTYGSIGNTGLSKDDVLNCDNYLLFMGGDYDSYTIYRYLIVIDESAYSCSLGNETYDNFEVGSGDTLTINFYGYGSNNGKFITISVEHNKTTGNYSLAGYGYNSNVTLQLFNAFIEQFPLSYPLEIKNNFYYGDQIVLTNETSPTINVGHAIEPNFDPDLTINDSNGDPITHPNPFHPTPYTPIPFNPPSIDLTSVESLLESIFNLVSYGFGSITSNISGFFNNLLSNLDGWLENIVSSLYFAANKVIGAINNSIDFLYNNFVSLFEPLYDFLSVISTFFSYMVGLGTVDGEFTLTNLTVALFFPDVSAIENIISNSDSLDLINICNSIVNSVKSIWTGILGISPIKTFHVPSLFYHGVQIGNFDIDFTWYDSYKPLGDGIISAFLIFNYLWFLFFRLPSFLRGSSNDFNHDVQAAADSGHETFKGKVGF